MGTFEDNLDKAEENGFEENEEESQDQVEDENMFEGCLMSPFFKDEDHPMVMITSDGVVFVGGLIDTINDGVLLSYPMIHLEAIMDSKVAGGGGKLQVGMRKPIAAIEMRDNQWFRHSSIVLLKSKNEGDTRIVEFYEKSAKEAILGESNIKMPTPEETSVILSGK